MAKVTKECVLYYNAPAILMNLECNMGIDLVLNSFADLRKRLNFRVVDTSRMSEHEIQMAYMKAITPSVWKKYRIRGVFGTHRYAGSKFGRTVPALIIQSLPDKRVEDVFPHEESGRIITIYEYLARFLGLESSPT